MPLIPCYLACQSTPSTPGLSQQWPTNIKDLIQVQTPTYTYGLGKAKSIIAGKIILATSKKSATQIYRILKTEVLEDTKLFKVHDILTIDITIVLLKLHFR